MLLANLLLMRKSLVCTMECRPTAVCFYLISVLAFARAQIDCTPFTENLLGTTNATSTTGLVGDVFQAVSGDPLPVSVQVHASRIVCLRSGRTRDTYSGVSVVVRYSCTGAPSECTGNPTLSQFEFECATGPTWTASVGGSASNIITTPPNGSLSTTLRTDCGVCVSPARSGFATITNNEQHCGRKLRLRSTAPEAVGIVNLLFLRQCMGSLYWQFMAVALFSGHALPSSSHMAWPGNETNMHERIDMCTL